MTRVYEEEVKRGRGRPRKNPLPEDTPSTPKRGRGRPRKNPLPEITDNDLNGLFTGPNPKITKVKTIDGYTVEIEGVFTPTKEWMYEKYNSFNKRYFNGKLISKSISQFIVEKRKGRLGVTHCVVRASYNGRISFGLVRSIGLSTYYGRTEKTYCSTLLHEMIHVYEIEVLERIPGHEKQFTDKMKEINSYGEWEISTTETPEERDTRGALDSTVRNKISKKYLGIMKNGPYYMGFLYPRAKKTFFDNVLSKSPWYGITYSILDPDFFGEYPNVTLAGSTIRGKKLTKGDIDKMIQENRIQELFRENKRRGYSLSESIKNAIEETDPYVTVTNSKELDDGTVLIDMEII